ncbi:hemolysin family protein [Longispora albida]|uniref:hemolysin family protein n=1 Tax=Longispora albida TaxID=203523 RepID=UPI001B7F7BDE|nr:hemolysin family protein [Longispora albida]
MGGRGVIITVSDLLPLAVFVLLTAASAFFVAAEFSLVTVDRAAIDQQVAAGDRRSGTVQKALRTLSFQLSGAQLGITLTALLSGYLAKPAIASLLAPVIKSEGFATGVALGIATLFSMLFGELVPKNAALARPMPIARATANGQRAFSTFFGWLIKLLNGSANWLVRRLGIEPQEELASARSPEELGLLAAMSAKAGAMDAETAALLRRTIRFGDKRAAEAMTPRVDVVALPADARVADLIKLVRETGRSRFPIYVDTLDQVIGVATVNDALSVDPDERVRVRVRAVAKEPVFVPESLDLDNVLEALRRGGSDLAIVIDEYGGTDGVVTIEDLVEELVGEIVDEHDRRELAAPVVSETVSGVLREDEVLEQTGFTLPEGPYETLAGFLLAQLGHIPEVGERVEHEGWEFTVTDMDKHRIEQVKVVAPPSADEDAES